MPATYNAIKTVTVGAGGAATILFDNIPQTYTDLVLRMSLRGTNANIYGTGFATINNDTAANYNQLGLFGNGSNSVSPFGTVQTGKAFIGDVVGNTAASNIFAPMETYFYGYTSTNSHKTYVSYTATENTTTPIYVEVVSGIWRQNSAITKIELSLDSGSFVQHSTASLYGILNT